MSKEALRYRTIDPDDKVDIEELLRQRRICGWDEDQVAHNVVACRDGDMAYFLFYLSEDGSEDTNKWTVIGSGGLDLNGVQNAPFMCSRDRREFCVMGMFLYEEFRGLGLFRPMAEMLLNYGFSTLACHSATVMTHHANPLTNYLFPHLGFVEFYREDKLTWNNPGVGIHYRMSREEWIQRETRNDSQSHAGSK